MPVTLLDRLPLPNLNYLKVYTAGSVLLLSVAVFHALTVTSDPNWRTHIAVQWQKEMAAEGDTEILKVVQAAVVLALNVSGPKNLTEQFVEVMTYMMQERLCTWTLVNISYCALALFGFVIQRAVFGRLRVAEAQRVKDKLWNYVFYKFIFVFGVINVQFMDEVLLWCTWFTVVGFLHLLGQLCKDRFEYLSSSPNTCRWAHVRVLALLGGIQSACMVLLALTWSLPAGRDTFAFMACEAMLVLLEAVHVMARYALQAYETDAAGPLAYYTQLGFESSALVVELVHVIHMVVYSNMLVSMASLVLLMQLRHLLHELQARVRRHRTYTSLHEHMSRNYPMASKEEVENNQDNCAICWEPMKEARKLPCSHLFHNSCLCQWVQQDASCPTCRRALAASGAVAGGAAGGGAGAGPQARQTGDAPQPPPRPNHLFHFDGSRYISWLPSFSVEVTRVRMDPPAASQIDAMVRQVQAMFPQYPAGLLAAELASTRSTALTVDNILEGRLPLPPGLAQPPPPPPPPAPATRPAAPLLPEARAAGARYRDAAVGADLSTPDASPGTEFTEQWPLDSSAEFSDEARQRELLLRRRQERLLAAARRRHLARRAAPATAHAPAPAPTAAPAAAAAPRDHS